LKNVIRITRRLQEGLVLELVDPVVEVGANREEAVDARL